MYRVVKMGHKNYAMQVDLDNDLINIRDFVESGNVVILCNELKELAEYAIAIDTIELVAPE